jgi:hypothetical protein
LQKMASPEMVAIVSINKTPLNQTNHTKSRNLKLRTNLRNAEATFGTDSPQYQSILGMVESYTTGPKIQDFALVTTPSTATSGKASTRQDSIAGEQPSREDASTAAETAHTFTLSNLVYRPKQS